jgi:hypothetical protein
MSFSEYACWASYFAAGSCKATGRGLSPQNRKRSGETEQGHEPRRPQAEAGPCKECRGHEGRVKVGLCVGGCTDLGSKHQQAHGEQKERANGRRRSGVPD